MKIEKLKNNEDMDIPSILYKYRDWEDVYHKRVLTHKELYLAPPASFEDEYDCRVPTRNDLLTDKEISDIYTKESKKENPHFNQQEHRNFVKEYVKKGLLRNEEHLADVEKTYFEEFNERFGVLSLTAIPDNHKMWVDYADNHKGFCVGFKSAPLLKLSNFPSHGKVRYYDELPIIRFTDDPVCRAITQIISKSNKYSFEKEYRITKIDPQKRQTEIAVNIFTEIILGARMPEDSKNEIISLVKEKFPKMQILQSEIENDSIIINN